MAKGEIAHHEQFHLWPQCFQKSSAAIAAKCVYSRERVNEDEIHTKIIKLDKTVGMINAEFSHPFT